MAQVTHSSVGISLQFHAAAAAAARSPASRPPGGALESAGEGARRARERSPAPLDKVRFAKVLHPQQTSELELLSANKDGALPRRPLTPVTPPTPT